MKTKDKWSDLVWYRPKTLENKLEVRISDLKKKIASDSLDLMLLEKKLRRKHEKQKANEASIVTITNSDRL